MVETAQAVFTRALREVAAPALRRHGLRGSGQSYVLPDPSVWAQLGFQKSTSSTAQLVRFTVNLKVTDKEQWDEQRREHSHVKDTPPPGDDPLAWAERQLQESFYPAVPPANTLSGRERTRLGHLIPEIAQDHWWEMGVADASDVVGDAVQAIVTYGLPWLRRHLHMPHVSRD